MSTSALRVEIHLPSLLREAAGGSATVSVEAATFSAAVDALVATHPLLQPHLFDDTGTLRDHINLFLNDQNIRWLESWDTPLRVGDTVTIVQAVSGG